MVTEAIQRLLASARLRHSLFIWSATGTVAALTFSAVVSWAAISHPLVLSTLSTLAGCIVVTLVLALMVPLLRLPDAHTIDYYGVPNGLTAIRACFCVPLLLCAALPLHDDLGIILWGTVGGTVGVLDIVDGYVARRFGPITELGQALDPTMDAAVFSVGAVGCYLLHFLPGWLAIVMLVRYLAPFLATPLVFMAHRRPELVHTVWGRRNTAACGLAMFTLMWVRIFHGPVDAVAVPFGALLVVPTMLLHFRALTIRVLHAPTLSDQ